MAAQPDVTPACRFGIDGWACAGTGFLWLAGQPRPAGAQARIHPCPACNTEAFLDAALRRSRADDGAGCPCCGPPRAMPQALRAALDLAARANPAATEAFLHRRQHPAPPG